MRCIYLEMFPFVRYLSKLGVAQVAPFWEMWGVRFGSFLEVTLFRRVFYLFWRQIRSVKINLQKLKMLIKPHRQGRAVLGNST